MRAYGNSAVAAAAATEATCVLDIVVTRRCRAHFCVPRGAWPEGGRQSGNRGQFSLESCSEPKNPLLKPLQSYPSLWRSVFLLLQFSKLYWHVQVYRTMYRFVHTHIRGAASRGRRRRMVAIGVGSPVAQPAKPLASSSASPRRWAEEAGSAFRIRRSR